MKLVFIVSCIGTTELVIRDQHDQERSIVGIGNDRILIRRSLAIAKIPVVGIRATRFVIELQSPGHVINVVCKGK